MGNKIDIAEVEHFSDELKEASSNLHTQLNEVKNNIETVNGMKSFSGKAADAAKGYFTDVHLTLLESFGNLFEDLQTNVDQHMKTFRFKVDGNDNAIIRSNYLKEIKKEMQDVYEKLVDEEENIHETIQEVTDISSATSPSFSDVKEWKDNSIEKIQEVNEDLESFTSTGDEEDVDEIMHQIEVVMDSVQTNNGQARFANFSGISMIKELEQLNAYNQLRAEDSDKVVEEISQKLMNGEALNSEEREILYQHIQAELTLEDRKHMTDLALRIDNEEEFKNYVNEKVLYSEANLEDEIMLLEKYLYTGNERPEDLPGKVEDRAKLRSYLDILKNYQVAIYEVKEKEDLDWSHHSKDDPLLARVEFIRYEPKLDSKANNYGHMESEITIDYHQDLRENGEKTREDYLNGWAATGRANYSEVEYYMGAEAVGAVIGKEGNEARDKYNNMDNEFYGEKLLGFALSKANHATNAAYEVKDYLDHEAKKEEQNHKVNFKETEDIAFNLAVEIKVNKRDVPRTWDGKDRQIEVSPTDETFERIRRWEAIHEKVPNAIPFDAEAAKNQDWAKLNQVFHEIDSSEYREYYEFITQSYPSDNPVVEETYAELYH